MSFNVAMEYTLYVLMISFENITILRFDLYLFPLTRHTFKYTKMFNIKQEQMTVAGALYKQGHVFPGVGLGALWADL